MGQSDVEGATLSDSDGPRSGGGGPRSGGGGGAASGGSPASAAESADFATLAGGSPAPGWDRYEVLELLGSGGMGAVYRARDRRLDRTVAIKFLHRADPSLAVRLVREARAQAQIDHPGVCRVLEVGEIDGRAYLALQFVAGEPLHIAARRMTLDERVAALRDVALAIEEAHRLGIIHRDLKPGNVLIERTAGGRWAPVVMDFGLARELAGDAALTRSGAVLGTPAYMAPEQARGDLAAIDRRSDVYGLGATLYELVTGQAPFAGTVQAELLARVIHDDPAPPRQIDPGVPVALDTVVLQCLAKDPARRYRSARALADDLDRYLAGEPVLGRRPSAWQRLARRARRHRAVVAIAAASLISLAILGGLAVQAWLGSRAERARSADRAALAQRLGEDARDIELVLRGAYQLPLQDVRPAREAARARMRAIAATRHDLGPLGDAIVHAALGRGDLALHDWQAAADELARAAGAGLATPELHAGRGRALGELYHAALDAARRSGDRGWLAARQRELERQYLAPALAELAEARGGGDPEPASPSIPTLDRSASPDEERRSRRYGSSSILDRSVAELDARIALYRGELATAERAALAAAEGAPWRFEAIALAGDAAYAAATAALDRGDYPAARAAVERAEGVYARATEIARSDAALHLAVAQAAVLAGEIAARDGGAPREPLARALAAIERAVTADPDAAPAYTARAYALLRWYRTPALRGAGDQRPLLDRIAAAAARAVALDPGDAGAWDALGNARVYRGSYEAYHGGDGAPWWRGALDDIGRALAIRPGDPWGHNDLAVAHRWLGTALDDRGGDPMPEYRAALRGYERATEIDPDYLYAWFNQADLAAVIAARDVDRGVDPAPAVDRARRAGDRGLAIDPGFDLLLDKLAEAELAIAGYRVASGGDPAPALAAARGYLDRAIARNPASMTAWFHRAVAAGAEARGRLRDRGDPADAIAAGRAAIRETLQRQADSADAYVEAARLDLVEAEAAARAGRDPGPALARARLDAERAIALDGQFADAGAVAAEVFVAIARHQRGRAAAGARRDDAIDRGLAHAARALELHPHLPRALAARDALLALRPR